MDWARHALWVPLQYPCLQLASMHVHPQHQGQPELGQPWDFGHSVILHTFEAAAEGAPVLGTWSCLRCQSHQQAWPVWQGEPPGCHRCWQALLAGSSGGPAQMVSDCLLAEMKIPLQQWSVLQAAFHHWQPQMGCQLLPQRHSRASQTEMGESWARGTCRGQDHLLGLPGVPSWPWSPHCQEWYPCSGRPHAFGCSPGPGGPVANPSMTAWECCCGGEPMEASVSRCNWSWLLHGAPPLPACDCCCPQEPMGACILTAVAGCSWRCLFWDGSWLAD